MVATQTFNEHFQTVYAEAPPAFLSRRLAAMVYELLIVTAIVIMSGLIVSMIASEFAVSETIVAPDSEQTLAAIQGEEAKATKTVETVASQWVRGVIVAIAVCAAVAGWFVWCWVKTGQTLPMKVWSLRVQHPDGRKLSTLDAMLRLVVASVSLGLAGIGFWWSWLDPQRRTLHDIVCKTQVVRLPKEIRSV